MKLVEYDHEKPGYGPRLTAEEWEHFRPILTDLDSQGLSRKEIVNKARAEYGFRGTYAALNTRFKNWGLTNPGRAGSADTTHDGIDLNDYQSLETNTVSSLDINSPGLDGTGIARSNTQETLVPKRSPPGPNEYASPSIVDMDEHKNVSEPVIPSAMPPPALATHKLSANGTLAAEGTETSDTPESSRNTVPPYKQILANFNKRPRSEVSSIRSSRFSISSNARSFVQLAKRLRVKPPRISVTSLLSQLSDASSRRSQDYQLFSGMAPHLEAVKEEGEHSYYGRMSPRKLLRRRRARELLSWIPTRESVLTKDEKILAQLDQVIQEGTTFPQTLKSRTHLQKALSAELGEGVLSHQFLKCDDLNESQKATVHSLLQEFLLDGLNYELDPTKHFLLLWLSPSPRNWTAVASSSPLRGFVRPLRYYFEYPCVYIRFGFYGGHKAAFRLNSSALKIWPTSLGRRPTIEEQAGFDKHATWPNILPAEDTQADWAPTGYNSVVSLEFDNT